MQLQAIPPSIAATRPPKSSSASSDQRNQGADKQKVICVHSGEECTHRHCREVADGAKSRD